jgi:hypothetical protein
VNDVVQINLAEITAEPEAVLKEQGIHEVSSTEGKILELLNKAMDLFQKSARPVGLISELTKEEFVKIFEGEGNNEDITPLETIFPRADALALFAVTLGEIVSAKIEELFESNDFALGLILDTIASLAADKAAILCGNSFFKDLSDRGITSTDDHVLSYSPGYCGWHLSGQKKLFRSLQPERIGITLNDSFLMIPLKSVTGVLVSGKKEIHDFEMNYPFCSQCSTHTCRHRIEKLSGFYGQSGSSEV